MTKYPSLFPESKPAPAGTVDVEAPASIITHELDDPKGVRFHYVEVTPQMAEEWLERNEINRNVRKSTVAQLTKTMQLGEWRLTGELLKFDAQGVLLDGQHRLMAVVNSGITVPFHVCEGLASDVRRHLDTGSKRSYGDVLKMDAETHPSLLSSAVTWVYRCLAHQIEPIRFSHEECDLILNQHPDIREFCSYAPQVKGYARALGVALYYLCARKERDRADAFFDGLATGLRIENTPIYTVRERIFREMQKGRGRATNVTLAAFIIKAWNAYITGQPLTNLRWSKADGFPSIEE